MTSLVLRSSGFGRPPPADPYVSTFHGRSTCLAPEQFEQLYLQPGGVGGKGDLTKRFGNPTRKCCGIRTNASTQSALCLTDRHHVLRTTGEPDSHVS